MQCIRGNNNRSPPLSPIRTSLSMDSLNKYFSKRTNRKSLVRRSFEIIRKNVVRHKQYLLPQNSTIARKAKKKNGLIQNDQNNNQPSCCNSEALAQNTDQHFSNTYGVGGDVFVISTDSDILTSNTNSRQQFRSNVR